MPLNAPFAFYAATGVEPIPSVYTGSQWYYDSNQTTTFIDQTTNGNDGTITTAGSGGGSTVTHNVTANGNYWDFEASSPGSEQKYVDTGTNIGAVTNWSLMMIVADDASSTNAQWLYATDGGSDNLQFFSDRNNKVASLHNRFFARASDGTRKDILSTSGAVQNTLYFTILRYTGSLAGGSPEMELLINNSQDGTPTTSTINLNITANTNIGLSFTNSTTTNQFRIGAAGFWQNYYLTDTDCTNLYNYYDSTIGYGF